MIPGNTNYTCSPFRFNKIELDDLSWNSVLVDASQFVEDGEVSQVRGGNQKLGENLAKSRKLNKGHKLKPLEIGKCCF